ncbi:CoA ester lyase [Thermanaerothrix sp. 4228-RoL]|uniref:CoA ester lyase n=1 Tax=Thermanaerothrix solaris TaxID=3058434 RepID=A0ABU3NMA4_9CHLR|nr:CoA ester lyase [Thermanaerothrix sp. 4228-RoL]MDT8897973.1 CoA ester lyase [Thermanaerothrix sp. 4228-RoL]
MRARRALLYVPADDWHKIQKATTLGVDCVCLDLEDGVAQNRKEEARQNIARALATLDFGRAERLVRINGLESGLAEVDLAAVLPNRPDGIVLPKVLTAEDLRWVEAQIGAAEQRAGWPSGTIILLAIIERARAFLHLPEICQATPRLEALIFGAEDLAAELGVKRTREGWELFHARSTLVMHAAAFGLQAIDWVTVDFQDIGWVRQEAERGAALGFNGKQIIHPNQVLPVQAAFTPSPEEIAWARELLAAFEAHQAQGKGAFAWQGQMVDRPVIRRAEGILARAQAAGALD